MFEDRLNASGRTTSALIQSVDRALSILECFSIDHRERGVTEISKLLDLNKSTVHGLLSTLERRHYLEKSAENGKYRLGLKLLDLGTIKHESLELVIVAHPLMRTLVDKFQETTHLAIYDAGEVVYVDKIEARSTLNIISYVGKRNPAYCTGVGKCLLAHQPGEEVERVISSGLRPFTANTITDPEKFQNELDRVRREGYAFDNEEIDRGLVCIAAPIRKYRGNVVASLSIAAPTIRMEDEKTRRMVDSVKEVASAISKNLGYKQ